MKRFVVLVALMLVLATNGVGVAAAATTNTEREPSTGESWVAAVALLGAVGISMGILWLVNRAHTVQQSLAQSVVRRGGTAQTALETASGREHAAVDEIVITGPSQLPMNTAGEFSVPDSVTAAEWSVSGISSYARSLKGPRTFVFTPYEQGDGVEITVAAGGRKGRTALSVLPATPALPFVLRLAVRSWGLVLVAVVVVLGAVALGLTGHLDGANFVALVAPLAALLGVTVATSERSDDPGAKAR